MTRHDSQNNGVRHARLGTLPEDWRVQALGEILEPRRKPVAVDQSTEYREIGIRSHGKGLFHKAPITGHRIGSKRVFWIQEDCLIFNIVFAWEGAVAVTSENEVGMIASHRFPMYGPRNDNWVDVEFLRRFFQTEIGVELLRNSSPGGAGRNRTLNQKFLAEMPVPLPPIAEQRKIAAILASVDETIEKTEAVTAQLQVVKHAMMQDLFTRGLPGRHTRFKQTEVGEIPESWEVQSLGELMARGPDNGLYRPKTDYGSGTPIVRIDSFGHADDLPGSGYHRVRLPDLDVERYGLQPNDIIINRVNSISHLGKAAFVAGMLEATVFESNMMRIAVEQRILQPRFAFHWISSCFVRDYFVARAKRAVAQASINQRDVRELLVPIPSLDEQAAIAGSVDATISCIRREEEFMAHLHSMKSALMSALLTGQVRVTPSEDTP
jgi:type I restriction enzyme S subunit